MNLCTPCMDVWISDAGMLVLQPRGTGPRWVLASAPRLPAATRDRTAQCSQTQTLHSPPCSLLYPSLQIARGGCHVASCRHEVYSMYNAQTGTRCSMSLGGKSALRWTSHMVHARALKSIRPQRFNTLRRETNRGGNRKGRKISLPRRPVLCKR